MTKGWYVMTWGGGAWTSVAWFATLPEAKAEATYRTRVGLWSGYPPKVEAVA